MIMVSLKGVRRLRCLLPCGGLIFSRSNYSANTLYDYIAPRLEYIIAIAPWYNAGQSTGDYTRPPYGD